MNLGLINSAWAQAGRETAFGIRMTKEIGFDTIDIFADPLDTDARERKLIKDECDRLDLPIVREGDPALLNVYHVIAVNPANGRNIDEAGGQAFLAFVLSPEAQALIAAFGTDRFGEPLFTPCADNACGALPTADPAATPAA